MRLRLPSAAHIQPSRDQRIVPSFPAHRLHQAPQLPSIMKPGDCRNGRRRHSAPTCSSSAGLDQRVHGFVSKYIPASPTQRVRSGPKEIMPHRPTNRPCQQNSTSPRCCFGSTFQQSVLLLTLPVAAAGCISHLHCEPASSTETVDDNLAANGILQILHISRLAAPPLLQLLGRTAFL